MAKISACCSSPYQTQSLPPNLWLLCLAHGTEAANDLAESESQSERMILKFNINPSTLRFTATEIHIHYNCIYSTELTQASLFQKFYYSFLFRRRKMGKERCRMDLNSTVTLRNKNSSNLHLVLEVNQTFFG